MRCPEDHVRADLTFDHVQQRGFRGQIPYPALAELVGADHLFGAVRVVHHLDHAIDLRRALFQRLGAQKVVRDEVALILE